MKKNFLPVAFLMMFSFLTSQTVFSSIVPEKTSAMENGDGPGEKKPAKKSKVTRSKVTVKVFPDILKRQMHIVAKETESQEIDFFVFDMQGTLILNYKMKEGSREKIAGLARGTYIYRVFSGDEETSSGEFDIK